MGLCIPGAVKHGFRLIVLLTVHYCKDKTEVRGDVIMNDVLQ